MTEPLEFIFEVACSAEHAFDVWTKKIGTWWPTDHTVSGKAGLVVLQPGVGGRIYERTTDGVEHDWGRVTLWDPPTQLAYTWHLGAAETDATEVDIQFHAEGEECVRIEIQHRGWEGLGNAGDEWRNRNRAGWATLIPHFQVVAVKGDR